MSSVSKIKNLVDIPAFVLDLFRPSNKKLKVVLIFVDGFGYAQWKEWQNKLPLLKIISTKKLVRPIRTVFPSTTTAALTTLQTGLAPVRHGFFEWYLYIKEIDETIFSLPFSPLKKPGRNLLLKRGVSRDVILPIRDSQNTIYKKLKRKSVPSFYFNHKNYVKSAYSSRVFNGAIPSPFENMKELFKKLRKTLNNTKGPAYFYVYWDKIDETLHRYGSKSEISRNAIKDFFTRLQKFIEKEKSAEILFLITSDHGHIDVNPEKTLYLNKYRWLTDNFEIGPKGRPILPSGSPRDIFLHIKLERVREVKARLSELFGRKADVYLTGDLINKGIFGKKKPSKRFLERAGNVLIIPRKNYLIWYEHVHGVKFDLKGHHGGFSDKEMIIPFAVFRSSQIK